MKITGTGRSLEIRSKKLSSSQIVITVTHTLQCRLFSPLLCQHICIVPTLSIEIFLVRGGGVRENEARYIVRVDYVDEEAVHISRCGNQSFRQNVTVPTNINEIGPFLHGGGSEVENSFIGQIQASTLIVHQICQSHIRIVFNSRPRTKFTTKNFEKISPF